MFIRYPSRQRDIPLRLIVPNLLTTMGLCSGLLSIHFTLKPVVAGAAGAIGTTGGPDFDRAVGAIMVAAVFDMLDGRAARMLRASSKFGTVLDSLSDFLCFGIAPAVLMHQWLLKRPDLQPIGKPTEGFVLAAILLFALCSALRLARFTAAADAPKTDSEGNAIKPSPLASKFFVGMPTPAAAAAVLIPVMLKESNFVRGADISAFAIVAYTIGIAWLMVSRQPMYSFKKLRINRLFVVPMMLGVGIWFVLAAKDFWLAIAAIAGIYLLTLPLSLWSYYRTLGQMNAEQAAAEPVTAGPGSSSPEV